MKPMVLLAIIAFGLIFLQGLMSWLQYRLIQKKYKEVKARNKFVSVGRVKAMGRGCIALLGATGQGVITEGYLLKGLTVFARFRPIKGAGGKDYRDLEESLKPSMESDAILQALGFLERGLNKTEAGQETEEEFGETSSDSEELETLGAADE